MRFFFISFFPFIFQIIPAQHFKYTFIRSTVQYQAKHIITIAGATEDMANKQFNPKSFNSSNLNTAVVYVLSQHFKHL
jgi:hypothetical protein